VPRWRYLLTAVFLGLLIGYGLLLVRRKYAETLVVTPQDLAPLLPSGFIVCVPRLGAGRRPRRPPLADLALGAWVTFALGTSVLALAAQKGWVEAPGWLRPLLGGGA
jgi:hypothetical protein